MRTSASLLLTIFVLLVPCVAHAQVPTVVPATLLMFGDGGDYDQSHPEWGPIGALVYVTWDEVNPAPGVFKSWINVRNLPSSASARV